MQTKRLGGNLNKDKKKFISHGGIPYTQALFLELGYDTEVAVYTLKDWDYEYEGKTYPSIKRLYLQMEDVGEYNFATEYFLGWKHWCRMCENKAIRKHIDEWRNELELKLRSTALRTIVDMSAEDKGFQAAKYIAEAAWKKNAVGRPKKDTSLQDSKIEERLSREFQQDALRLREHIGG